MKKLTNYTLAIVLCLYLFPTTNNALAKTPAPAPATPTTNIQDEKFYWNEDGFKEIPPLVSKWDGYGAHAAITVPQNAIYESVNIRFWKGAIITGAFKTQELSSINHTAGTVDNTSEDVIIEFEDPVTITDEVILQQSSTSPNNGIVFVFKKGLKGSPKCSVVTSGDQYGNYKKSSEYTCLCNAMECRIGGLPKEYKTYIGEFRD